MPGIAVARTLFPTFFVKKVSKDVHKCNVNFTRMRAVVRYKFSILYRSTSTETSKYINDPDNSRVNYLSYFY